MPWIAHGGNFPRTSHPFCKCSCGWCHGVSSAVARCHGAPCMGSTCADAWRGSRAVYCASDSLGWSACTAGRRWWWWNRCCWYSCCRKQCQRSPSFGPAVDQEHKRLAEMREECQVHPNMESVFRRTYSSPSALPSVAWINYLPSSLSTRSLLISCAF